MSSGLCTSGGRYHPGSIKCNSMKECQMRTPETDEDRTTDIGLFNYATSYHRAADALQKLKLKATHPDAPKSWLYCHAIELYLKAHLRAAGRSVVELRKRYSHDLTKLEEDYTA